MLLRGPVCRPCLPSMDGFGLRNSRCWALSPLISPPMPGPLALYSLTLTYSYVLIPPPSPHSPATPPFPTLSFPHHLPSHYSIAICLPPSNIPIPQSSLPVPSPTHFPHGPLFPLPINIPSPTSNKYPVNLYFNPLLSATSPQNSSLRYFQGRRPRGTILRSSVVGWARKVEQ